MTGLAGKGGGYRNARNSAELFSRLNPYFVSVDSLMLFFGIGFQKRITSTLPHPLHFVLYYTIKKSIAYGMAFLDLYAR